MIKKKIIIYISFLLISFSQSLFSKVENTIILKVENEIITNYEIKNKIISTLILSNQEISQSNIDKLKKQALDYLVKQKLKKIELSKYNLKSDQKQIDQYLNNISSNDVNALKKKFEINNVDFQLFLDDLDIDFKWRKYIYQIYSKKIEIDEKNVAEELKELLENQSNINQYKISEIEIFLNNDPSDKEKISNIKDQIKKYGFENIAIKYSISPTAANKGDLGWLNAKSLNKEIFDLIKDIKIGSVTEPLITPNSALFLKLNDKKTSKVKNLDIDKLKKNLIDQKKNEMFNLYSKSLLSKLKNNSLIEFNK